PSRRCRARHVEERKGLRARQAPHVETKSLHRRSATAVAAQAPCSRRKADFEGQHPLKPWLSDAADKPPYQAMRPRSYQLKPWPHEAQRRGWCPFGAPQSRLHLGIGAHAQHRARPRLIGHAEHLRLSREANRTRIAKTEPIPLGAKPPADAPLSILPPHPSKRFQLRRPSDSEGGVCCKPLLVGFVIVVVILIAAVINVPDALQPEGCEPLHL